MKNSTIHGAICVITIISLSPVSVQAYPEAVGINQSERKGPEHRLPPPEALAACEGRNQGDRIRFTTPRGRSVSAVCLQIQGRLAAVPDKFRRNTHQRNGKSSTWIDAASAAGSKVSTVVGTDRPPYPVVDTGQKACYSDEGNEISCPEPGNLFYGQDAQYSGNEPAYRNNGNGTVTDLVTGLMWQQSTDTDGDGDIDVHDKMTYSEAVSSASSLRLGGYSDWRLPTIKELYSLINFNGRDVNPNGADTISLVPFINTAYFHFAYGDTGAGERIIDAQYASSTLYVSKTGPAGTQTLFGVNFADGRIKGYGLSFPQGKGKKTFYVLYVRGVEGYGVNNYSDNGNTVTDHATGLMWAKNDSGKGMSWKDALNAACRANSINYLGYNDWRLPDIKELQSIVDYTRSPDTSDTPAIDPVFSTTSIINESGEKDYPYFWSSTTHARMGERGGKAAAYIAFGRGMGNIRGNWIDIHGAGAQRSDPKGGDSAKWPSGRGPQGDAIHIENFVRLVRDVN